MSYEFALENSNYEDYASGRVLYNRKGTTSYPARLIYEIFMRCVSHLERCGVEAPYSIYDPLCGGAYALTILGFLQKDQIRRIVASDIDSEVVEFAKKNLALLTDRGIEERIAQLHGYWMEYGKESHREALDSANRLKEKMRLTDHRIEIQCFCSDALKSYTNEKYEKFDMVITDVPYGEIVNWTAEEDEKAITLLLENLLTKLSSHSVVALSTRKKTKVINHKYTRLEKFQVGKRQIIILRPNL